MDMHAGAKRQLLYGCVYVREIIHSLKLGLSSRICSAQSENRYNSGIALRKVRIPKLADRVRILTLHGTIPELSVRKVRIGTK